MYVPTLCIQLGLSLTMSFDPLWTDKLGASLGMIALVAAGNGIGQLLFDLPAGYFGGRIREKPFMFFSLAGLSLCAGLRALATQPWHLLVIGIFMGMSLSAWGIGKVAYIRRHVQRSSRGRTMAYMGGMIRLSRIFTPVLGGVIVQFAGFRPLFGLQFLLFVAGALSLLLLLEDVEARPEAPRAAKDELRRTFRENGSSIIAAMIGITGLMLMRMSRALLFPLWTNHLGISALTLGIITGIGGLVETAMVLPAGALLDRAGRKWAAVPCTALFAVGFALLPLTHEVLGASLVFMFMSLANGLGSGINMVISSDLAPRHAAVQFLGIWRFVTDSSFLIGPLLAGFIAQLFALAYAPLAVAGIGLASSLVLAFGMKETRQPLGTPVRAPNEPAALPPSGDS